MKEFLIAHIETILLVGMYVLVAAVNSLPDPASEKFQLYPWIYHTTRQLLNAVPPKYTPKRIDNEPKP